MPDNVCLKTETKTIVRNVIWNGIVRKNSKAFVYNMDGTVSILEDGTERDRMELKSFAEWLDDKII